MDAGPSSAILYVKQSCTSQSNLWDLLECVTLAFKNARL